MTEARRFVHGELVVPPGGMYFIDAPGGARLRDVNVRSLWKSYAVECEKHGEPPVNDVRVFRTMMEDCMCRELPPGFCTGGSLSPANPRPTLSDAKRFLNVLRNRLAAGGDGAFVESRVSARRAEICSKCPENVSSGYCFSCAGILSLTRVVLGVRGSTPSDAYIGMCGVCKCFLRAKVHLSLAVLDEPDVTIYPESCWVRQETESRKD